ncbi:5-formyltetrahydrofolate cyclo-ligase [Bosea sp. (in: a-proteobacteria)]|uniref:5-formyltetrahydrofolate cyclo-ligase n=1 Tax=Bosea sp. (in: a-proteobacteria) TaxID=1871050 RepID=UPI0033402933
MTGDDDDEPRRYASPPCFMREVDPAYFGLAPPPPPTPGVVAWRKAQRERLIAERLALPASFRADAAVMIARSLDTLSGDSGGRVVSAYWPFRGEPDLRPWLTALQARGARTALPVVIANRAPLVFRRWRQGERLSRGVWNIPIPAEGEAVVPDIVIAPLVGFDPGFYRLGYGGGFFDRTLARLSVTVTAIGVGYDRAALASIMPQPHDVPMRHIVTETGVRSR